jgi:hypothetical protein
MGTDLLRRFRITNISSNNNALPSNLLHLTSNLFYIFLSGFSEVVQHNLRAISSSSYMSFSILGQRGNLRNDGPSAVDLPIPEELPVMTITLSTNNP